MVDIDAKRIDGLTSGWLVLLFEVVVVVVVVVVVNPSNPSFEVVQQSNNSPAIPFKKTKIAQ